MLFKKSKILKSKKSKNSLILELQKILNSNNNYFEGKITNDGFILLPIFFYGKGANMKGKLRPTIIGQFSEMNNLTNIKLVFKLSKQLKMILIITIIINIITLVLMIIFKNKYNFPFLKKIPEFVLFLVFTIIFFYIQYCYIRYKSIKILNKIV